MATNNIVTSNYLQRAVVRQRNSVTLIQWSASFTAQPIPDPATDNWVQQRIVAENIPQQLDSVVAQTLGFFLQDPATQNDILTFISSDNSTTIEDALGTENQGIAAAFMPRYAAATISPQQVEAWRAQNIPPVATS